MPTLYSLLAKTLGLRDLAPLRPGQFKVMPRLCRRPAEVREKFRNAFKIAGVLRRVEDEAAALWDS